MKTSVGELQETLQEYANRLEALESGEGRGQSSSLNTEAEDVGGKLFAKDVFMLGEVYVGSFSPFKCPLKQNSADHKHSVELWASEFGLLAMGLARKIFAKLASSPLHWRNGWPRSVGRAPGSGSPNPFCANSHRSCDGCKATCRQCEVHHSSHFVKKKSRNDTRQLRISGNL